MLFPQKNRLWFFVNLPVPNSTSSAFTSKLSRYMPLSRANSVRFTVCVAQPLLSVYRQQQGWITKYRKWIGKREKVFMLNTHSQRIGPADVPILFIDVPVEPPGFSTKHCLDWTRNWFPIGVSAGNSTRYGRVFCYKATPFTRHKSPNMLKLSWMSLSVSVQSSTQPALIQSITDQHWSWDHAEE